MVLALITNVVKGGILIGSVTNLGSGSNGISARRNLNRSLGLPIITTTVVGGPQDGVYQFNNDYSCEQDCRLTTNELNGCWRVQKYKCCKSKKRILRTIYCNHTNS
jgi:hypothetical protein